MKIGKTSPQDQQRFPLLDSAAARLVKIETALIFNIIYINMTKSAKLSVGIRRRPAQMAYP